MLAAFKANLTWILGAAIIIGLMIAGTTLYNHGKSVAALECAETQKKAIEAAVTEAKRDWDSQKAITSNGIQNVNTTKEKIVYIERRAETIQAPLCTDLGSDYSGVYNDAIRAIKEGTDTGRNVSASKVPNPSFDGNATGNSGITTPAESSSKN
jgi:hypothetical protein